MPNTSLLQFVASIRCFKNEPQVFIGDCALLDGHVGHGCPTYNVNFNLEDCVMKKITSLLLASGLLFTSLNATAANVWKYSTTIQGVQSLADGGFVLTLPAGSDPACQNGGTYFYVLPNQNGVTLDGVRVTLSIALVAYTNGKKINLLYDNASPNQGCFVQSLYLTNS